MRNPNFFILGAPKCGTTSLAAWLAEHPNIFISPIKEPNFFNTDLNKHVISDWQQYLKLYNKATDEHIAVGEASTTYLYSREAARNIENSYPGSRYIVMVRNPVEMAYALHEQEVFAGHENILDFKRAWEMSPERRKGLMAPSSCTEPRWLDYQKVSALGEQLERLYNYIPKERILVLLLDDIKINPQSEYKKVLEFLGVPIIEKESYQIYNPSKRARWVGLSRFISVTEKYAYVIKRKFGISHIPTGILSYIKNLNRENRPRPVLSQEFKKLLIDYYKEDIIKLERLINRDLSFWFK